MQRWERLQPVHPALGTLQAQHDLPLELLLALCHLVRRETFPCQPPELDANGLGGPVRTGRLGADVDPRGSGRLELAERIFADAAVQKMLPAFTQQ